MAGKKVMKEAVVIPLKIEKEFKNVILDYCRKEGMTFSGLVRKLLTDYAKQKGVL